MAVALEYRVPPTQKEILPSPAIHIEPTQQSKETRANWLRWMNDPDIRMWMYDDLPSKPEEIYRWVYNATHDPKRHYFDIKIGDKTVGLISLRQDQKPDNTGEIGIVIGEKGFQEKGVGKQAVAQLLAYAKDTVHLHSVRAMIKPDNARSIHLFMGQGFVETGRGTIQGTKMIRFEKPL